MKAIAIDFDGCICTNAFPNIGTPNRSVINKALAEQAAGAGLILWTHTLVTHALCRAAEHR